MWLWDLLLLGTRRESSAWRPESERRYSATSALTKVPRSAPRILALR